MTRRPWLLPALGLVLAAALVITGAPAGGQTPKRGGVLNAMLAEDPPGFSLYNYGRMQDVWLDR
jgi:hypothetical protein